MPNILKVENASKYYGKTKALNGVNFEVPENSIFAILGPNGSGKSTLLDLIAGKRLPTSGKIKLGETVHIGYLDQHTNDLNQGSGLKRKVIEFVEEARRVLRVAR